MVSCRVLCKGWAQKLHKACRYMHACWWIQESTVDVAFGCKDVCIYVLQRLYIYVLKESLLGKPAAMWQTNSCNSCEVNRFTSVYNIFLWMWHVHLNEWFTATSGKKVLLQELKLAAQFVVDSMMLTDVPLLFPPGQVGTFSMCKLQVNIFWYCRHSVLDLNRWISSFGQCPVYLDHVQGSNLIFGKSSWVLWAVGGLNAQVLRRYVQAPHAFIEPVCLDSLCTACHLSDIKYMIFGSSVTYCIIIAAWREYVASTDCVSMLHLKLALAALRTANQEEPKVDFNRYILDGGWIMPESLEY